MHLPIQSGRGLLPVLQSPQLSIAFYVFVHLLSAQPQEVRSKALLAGERGEITPVGVSRGVAAPVVQLVVVGPIVNSIVPPFAKISS